MNLQVFSFEDDLSALSALSPTSVVKQRIASYLQSIQASSTLAQRDKLMGLITGYMQALEDLELLTAEQQKLLRELVTRANMRSSPDQPPL
ncbi:MAG TPA: hypothetical protein VF671_13355 [Pseudomonas sp.]|jgi:hypothetical protein|uniref:hypothetical protein n=1 Tax=Pseudomonas sp. TaxID=306 RepID=UPI002EDA1F59